jgi:FMN-dependent NADH-azoreductase
VPKLLHLACSPRADSESAAGARVFMESFRKARPDWEIDAMNLWREPLPEFEGYLQDLYQFPARRLRRRRAPGAAAVAGRSRADLDADVEFFDSL